MNQGTFVEKYGNIITQESDFSYFADIVLCIDGTGSMSPIIELVKENALRLPGDLHKTLEQKGKHVDQLRIKVLVFRDYACDGDGAMQVSRFMTMDEDLPAFKKTVDEIIAVGGGDEPENGLEALAYAMASDWAPPAQGRKRRQVIVVWSDASTHKLGHGSNNKRYDPKLPADFETLTSWWGDDPKNPAGKMHYVSKRLLLFTPETGYWADIPKKWDNVLLFPVMPGNGMEETTYEEVIKVLANSLGG